MGNKLTYLHLAEAAALAGVSHAAVQYWAQTDLVRAHKDPYGYWVVCSADVIELMEKRRANGEKGGAVKLRNRRRGSVRRFVTPKGSASRQELTDITARQQKGKSGAVEPVGNGQDNPNVH